MIDVAVTSFNAVRKGVISALDQHFPNTRVYGEEISQGFQEPCFFVKLFPGSEKRVIGNRYKRYHAFDIHYFSNDEYINDDLHEMAEKLYTVFGYINVNGDLCAGTEMEHEIVDGVLHFFVHINLFVMKETDPLDEMNSLSINGAIRGD